MNKETYEALKNIISFVNGEIREVKRNDIKQVENYINEVEKDY